MQRIAVSIRCTASYPAEIFVPDGLDRVEAVQWINKNKNIALRGVSPTALEWINDEEAEEDFAEFIS